MTKATVYFIRDVESGQMSSCKHPNRFMGIAELVQRCQFTTHKPTAVRAFNEVSAYTKHSIREDGEEVWYATNQHTADIHNCAVHIPPITVRVPQFELVEVEVDFSFIF